MPIPNSQLETWSHQGSITQSSTTYATIKAALEKTAAPYATRPFRVFLQGSYCNDTNIYKESDVDVVISTDSVFYSDLSGLSSTEQTAYHASYPNSAYSVNDFRDEVIS